MTLISLDPSLQLQWVGTILVKWEPLVDPSYGVANCIVYRNWNISRLWNWCVCAALREHRWQVCVCVWGWRWERSGNFLRSWNFSRQTLKPSHLYKPSRRSLLSLKLPLLPLKHYASQSYPLPLNRTCRVYQFPQLSYRLIKIVPSY